MLRVAIAQAHWRLNCKTRVDGSVDGPRAPRTSPGGQTRPPEPSSEGFARAQRLIRYLDAHRGQGGGRVAKAEDGGMTQPEAWPVERRMATPRINLIAAGSSQLRLIKTPRLFPALQEPRSPRPESLGSKPNWWRWRRFQRRILPI